MPVIILDQVGSMYVIASDTSFENKTSDIPSATWAAEGSIVLRAWLVIILPIKLAIAKALADVFLSVRSATPSTMPNTSKKSESSMLVFLTCVFSPALVLALEDLLL